MIPGGKKEFIISSPGWLEKDALDGLPPIRPFLQFVRSPQRARVTRPLTLPAVADWEEIFREHRELEEKLATITDHRKSEQIGVWKILGRRTTLKQAA